MPAASNGNTSSNEDSGQRMELGMRNFLISAIAAALMAASGTASTAAVRELPYPAVKVAVAEFFKTDAAFDMMRKSFADAVAKKDALALFGLVGPTFVWIAQGQLAEQLDLGRDALHNFKVVFGFREHGKDTDGPVPDGPFWDSLQAFAADETHYAAGGALACGPTGAAIVDDKAFEVAKQRIGADDSIEWYFTVADTDATATPAGGAPVGRVGQVALPVLKTYPALSEGATRPVTHLQVLLPSGKSGWIPLSAARPLVTDRLCYALTADGTWKIAAFDAAE
jgi:hypothetical protein